MADPLSVVGGVVSVVSLALQVLSYVKSFEKVAISRTYGRPLGWLIITFFGNTATEYERIERVVLGGSDEEALRFRDSVITECNMTAVTVSTLDLFGLYHMSLICVQGAIIAQVALTALSLPSLSLAHWTARAFLLFATVAGCLSVYYACTLSRNIGKCYQAKLVRDWLSAATQHMENAEANEKNETQASLSGIFILSAPYTMMSYAILAFVTGLAIYQGFVWTRTLDTDAGKDNSRNVFIAYIVSTGFCELFFLSAGMIKAIESLLIRGRSRTKSRDLARDNRDFFDSHRKIDEPLQLDEYTSTTFGSNNAAASTRNVDAASQQQTPQINDPFGGLAEALERAAKAHILSAEADRRVASEYAKMSRRQVGSTIVE